MWVIFLEAGLALLLLSIIVWATWPRRRQGDPTNSQTEEKRDE
ncbi:hypothetical protein [Thauera sinica]|uniref:Uncharacterized protein n=1 Tax=Thauera sinica TaxID=2665146 RepID=A0ABW1ATT0_9RHOO|nr:hypothetical protein [Thauera sp. K11]